MRFGEWQALCSVLGADFDEAELHTIATESPLVTVAPSAHRPIGFTHERDARTLRSDIPAEARPTRDLVLDVFDAENAPLVPEDQLPAGLTHEPTRRFLTTTGFPAVNDFLSLNTHNLAGTGFTEHALEGTKDFETRPTTATFPTKSPAHSRGRWKQAGPGLPAGSNSSPMTTPKKDPTSSSSAPSCAPAN
ncbi:SUKH-4 family immunity protein [Streptomyces nigra]|uniref:SUKH-4 family immunity protein n=1 Tax=Streptomyces TaxID=1883 RepID=UPI001F442D83|nr:SUKH-4 family immunity protein [Streptomyces sp. FB2]MCF2539705.1 SUKH-4 family immunity protein [Streptomyces sp. FB2]